MAPPACTDSTHNGDETDVDCGGSCSPCANGRACVDANDCESLLCDGSLCCTSSTYGTACVTITCGTLDCNHSGTGTT